MVNNHFFQNVITLADSQSRGFWFEFGLIDFKIALSIGLLLKMFVFTPNDKSMTHNRLKSLILENEKNNEKS